MTILDIRIYLFLIFCLWVIRWVLRSMWKISKNRKQVLATRSLCRFSAGRILSLLDTLFFPIKVVACYKYSVYNNMIGSLKDWGDDRWLVVGMTGRQLSIVIDWGLDTFVTEQLAFRQIKASCIDNNPICRFLLRLYALACDLRQ